MNNYNILKNNRLQQAFKYSEFKIQSTSEHKTQSQAFNLSENPNFQQNVFQTTRNIEMNELSRNDNQQRENTNVEISEPFLPQILSYEQQKWFRDQKQLILNVTLIYVLWSIFTFFLIFQLFILFNSDLGLNIIQLAFCLIGLYLSAFASTKNFAKEGNLQMWIFVLIVFLSAAAQIGVYKCFSDDEYENLILLLFQTVLNGLATLIIFLCILCGPYIVNFKCIVVVLLVISGIIIILLLDLFFFMVAMLVYSLSLLSSLRKIYVKCNYDLYLGINRKLPSCGKYCVFRHNISLVN